MKTLKTNFCQNVNYKNEVHPVWASVRYNSLLQPSIRLCHVLPCRLPILLRLLWSLKFVPALSNSSLFHVYARLVRRVEFRIATPRMHAWWDHPPVLSISDSFHHVCPVWSSSLSTSGWLRYLGLRSSSRCRYPLGSENLYTRDRKPTFAEVRCQSPTAVRQRRLLVGPSFQWWWVIFN